MNALTRLRSTSARGILAAYANTPPAAAELTQAFAAFRTKHTADLEAINAQLASMSSGLNDLASRNAALLIGGLGPTVVEGDRNQVNAAFRDFIRAGSVEGLQALQANAAMSVGSDPEGGYSVYPTMSTGITKRIFETSPLRAYARVVSIGTDRFEELNDLYEPDVAWVGEQQARPETGTPDLGVLTIPVHEQYAMPKVTQKLLDDSSLDLASWLIDKVGAKFARSETGTFFTGDGILKPRGFLSYSTVATADSTRAWGVLQHIATGTSAGFGSTSNGADKLIDLQAELKAEYRAKAVWLMNRRTAAGVRKLKDTSGAFLWQPATVAGQPDTLLGSPVVLCEDMPDIAADSLSIAYGDFGAGYTIVDRQGDRLLRDPYTAKPHVLFYVYRRVGGNVNNFEAIKLLKFGTS
jgi:HK97 family phage major capsid protein